MEGQLLPWEPVAGFDLNNKQKLSFKVKINRPFKYIVLKPTGNRQAPDNYAKFFSS